MKIAQIAPLYESVPPLFYGGTERVVAHLTDALVDLGHDVTLFASADARTKGALVPVRDQAMRLDPCALKSDLAAHLAMLHEVRTRADEFDVMHFHIDMIHFPFFEHCPLRTLTTLHGRLDMKDLGDVYRRWMQYPLVSISEDQRRPLRFANWVATVHHGLPSDLYRIAPEKRPDRAINIARRAGRLLKIAAKVDAADATYFRDSIKPMLVGPSTDFVGEIGDAEKNELLGGASALLFPIDWPEPFGLVMIEAMACGTPVIAWDRGSVSEIVDHGVTGFVVRSEEEAVAALRRADDLDRRTVRKTFERRFSAGVMAQNYLDSYSRLQHSGVACGARLLSA
ncbi:MAG: glycosyltransferase family 4 protein [Betaproteobacteria bacterium]|nr:MAG: glycosyltransferase family 4 protein [Betaproteobacteria bacterium]